MPGVSVKPKSVGIPLDREAQAAAWASRLRVRRVIVSALVIVLSAWLANAALSPSSGLVEQFVLLLMAVLLPLHLVFFQLDGIRILDRIRHWPKPFKLTLVLLAMAASPLVLYPVGLIAILVAIFAGGGAAAPALAVTGTLMLSPIIAIFVIALMFMLSGYKGG
jgi:CheY-like chemotaxis protein